MLGGLLAGIVQRPRRALARGAISSAWFCLKRGKGPRARSLARLAVHVDRTQADGHEVLGLIAKEAGDLEQALEHLQAAIALDPRSPHFNNHTGVVLTEMGRFDDARKYFKRALRIEPGFAHAHCNLGLVERRCGRVNLARKRFKLAYEMAPDLTEAADNYVMALRECEWYEAAESVLRLAMARQPSRAKTRRDLAVILRETGRLDEAARMLRDILRNDPRDGKAWSLLGMVERDRRQFDDCDTAFQRAAELLPEDDSVRLHRALSLLVRGNFALGWKEYEARYGTEESPDRGWAYPRWDGARMAGTLLIYAEQGLGDEIMFASCVPDAAARVGKCVLECSPRLETLFARSFPDVQVVSGKRVKEPKWLQNVCSIDRQIAAGSLPLQFRRGAGEFPLHGGYLRADPAQVNAWRTRLASLGEGVKVGISWKGGIGRTMRLLRSIDLEAWAPVLSLPGMTFISLQYGEVEADLESLAKRTGVSVLHWPEVASDFDDLAALICALDQVVTVCNATVHLAGALGRPVIALAPTAAEWRYQCAGETMPWYPSVRVLRQEAAGDWGTPMRRAARELQDLAR